MSTVGSRTSHRFSTHSRSTSVASNSTRRLSTIPYSNSPINSRFSERRLSVPREPQQLGPRSKDDDQSTEMITIALAKAQNAVLLDQRNNVTGALDGYSQCCAILAEVIAKETDSDDITRLRQIHDTYSVRMHVLSKMQLDPNATRDMPPLPTQADLVDFEDEEDEDEFLRSFAENRISHDSQLPRYSEIYPPPAQKDTPSNHVHRTTSSRDSNGTSRAAPPLSGRKSSHSRTSSYARTYSQDGILSSLEQIPNKSSINSVPKRETIALPEMSEEEMDDAAFLERITRGFTSEEEILEEEPARPSTASTTSSASHQNHQQKKLPETFNFDQPPSLSRTETEDYVLPSPRSNPRQPTPPPKSKHDRARNTSSPLPTSTAPPRPSSAKKNLSVSNVQAQPMLKSLSANNAIPNADEVIVPGNLDAAPAVPPKIKKRPHLIRVVSETTMRTNYGSSRLSTFESSPVSPSSTGSAVTPGTSTGPGFFSETSPTAVRNAIVQDREGAAPPESPPEDPYHRPYWLMKSLIASMRNSKGAYVTQKLFIPQGVWTAKNAKIKATEEKMNCFHTMTMAVRQVLEADDRNIPLLLQEVASLEGTIDVLQQNLQRKLDGKTNGINGTNGDSRTMTRKMSQSTLLGGWGKRLRSKSIANSTTTSTNSPSGKDLGIDAAYPNAVLALFECALYLEQKFESLDPEDMPIKTQLRLEASRRRIAEFFANVVIRFILQDLGTMMNKYAKRVNDWIVG